MKIKQKLKPFIYTAAVLCMSLSCKKDPPLPVDPLLGFSCSDGTCCGRDNTTYEYVQKLENMPADYMNGALGGSFFYNQPIANQSMPIITLICDLRIEKIRGLKNTYNPNTWPLKYRVWGTVYADVSNPRLTAKPILYILIDKIETIN